MEVLFVIIPLLLLIGFTGSVLGIVSFTRIRDLQARLRNLEHRLDGVKQLADSASAAAEVETVSSAADEVSAAASISAETQAESGGHTEAPEQDLSNVTHPAEEVAEHTPFAPAKQAIAWAALFQQYWMVILGGICLVFAGIFLLRYSIESGWLGPTARIVLGLIFGAGLIVAGEILRRTDRLEAGVHAAFVASGSLVIYSALLVAFHLYELVSAHTAFAGMAIMSAFSMLLALKHGPLMAAMGLLGAYLVPILVNTGSNNIEAALLYSFIVTCASFWLQRYIYRSWLWWGTWVGALGWFVLSLDLPEMAQGMRALYLAALGYAGVGLSFAGLKLEHIESEIFPGRDVIKQVMAVFVALSVAMILLLQVESFNQLSYPAMALLPVVGALVARNNLPVLRLLPLITLLPIFVDLFSLDISFFDWKLTITPMVSSLQQSYITLLVAVTAAFTAIGGSEFYHRRHPGYWSAFVLFIPLVAIVLAYLRLSGMQAGLLWALPTFLIAGVYAFVLTAWRNRNQQQVVEVEAALVVAAQAAFAVACFFAFSEVTLTLILAVELIGLAWIDRKMPVAVLPLIMKVMLMLVIVRLTFNPWVALYEVSSLTLLLTYAGCLAACVLTSREVRGRPGLVVWLHSASAHLLVLTLAVFTRYMLYGGDIFSRQFNLTEASVYVCSWAAVGIVYEWKSRNLQSFRPWYRGLAMLHIVAAGALFALYNLYLHNPLWSSETIGSTPVFNLLLIAYGIPVMLAAVIYKRIPVLEKEAGVLLLIALYMFVTLEIRHLWNDGIRLNMPIREGELYTYSLAWLLLSVAIMVYGAYRDSNEVKKAGIIALLVVIAKAFLWDMRDLDGLWRVISFLGLGLSLLAIAYLFKKLDTLRIKPDT